MWTQIDPRRYQTTLGGLTVELTCQRDWWDIRWTVTDKDGKQSDGSVSFAPKEYKSPEWARQRALALAVEHHISA